MRDYTVMLNDGRKLGCAEYGQIDGEAVFVFHGTPGARYQIYAARLESIAQEGPVPLRIFVPERPGYGLSDAKAGRTLDDWCRDFEALADEIGVKRFSIVGISGGRLLLLPVRIECQHAFGKLPLFVEWVLSISLVKRGSVSLRKKRFAFRVLNSPEHI